MRLVPGTAENITTVVAGIGDPFLQVNGRVVGSEAPRGAAMLADSACSAYDMCMQYTIRRIPAAVDAALRARARAAGKSLNEAVVDALAEGSGMAGRPRKRRDLGDIARTWKTEKAVELALSAQDQVDEDLWR